MFTTTEDAVLDLADQNDDDLLTIDQVRLVINEHQLTFEDWRDSEEAALFGTRSPDGLLAWLGY
jgi:hypothetical protein